MLCAICICSVALVGVNAYDSDHMQTSTPILPSSLPPALHHLLPASLHGLCTATLVKKGSLLFQTGKKPQWMFFVVDGEVTLERLSQQGDPVVLQRTRHGFVSEASLQSAKYHCDARAVANSDVLQIPIQDLAQALRSDADFSARWISMLNQEVKRLRLQCERLSLKSVKERVRHLIHTEGKDGTYVVNTGLKSLASQLGVTHEALYRTLADLERSGELNRQDASLVLLHE
jgi:CRP/FNR family transcriptional regulator, dissimilatory nitrate respiration regulator